MCLPVYADSKDPDQTVWMHRLIRTFAVCKESLDTIECCNGEQRPVLDFAYVQDNVNPQILCMLGGNFLLVAAHLSSADSDCHVLKDYFDMCRECLVICVAMFTA